MNWVRLLLSLTFIYSFVGCGNDASFDLAPETDNARLSLKINDEVDILWVIDNSSSMEKHSQALASQMQPFVEALNETKLDYRMGITTTDMRTPPTGQQGIFIGQTDNVLSSRTPDLVNVVTNRMYNVGQGGSPVEQGLAAMKEALSEDKLNFQNAGFFREDSLLVVVFLTNEDDQSVNEDYVQFLDDLKPPLPSGERSWVAHFIGVLPDNNSCSTFGNDYQPGYKYLELVDASGGIAENICTADLRSALTAVKARVIDFISEFALEREPVVETIRVFVNGVEVDNDPDNGWIYLEDKNAIRFNGSSVPTADASIKIDYDPAGIKK